MSDLLSSLDQYCGNGNGNGHSSGTRARGSSAGGGRRRSADIILFAVAVTLLALYGFLSMPPHRQEELGERSLVTGADGFHLFTGARHVPQAVRHVKGIMRDELVAIHALALQVQRLQEKIEQLDDVVYVPDGRVSAAVEAARAATDQLGTRRGIPHIIHQMYGLFGDAPPKDMELSIKSFKEQNPTYTHILWNATDIEIFVEEYFPAIAPAFRRLRMPVLKSDISRYLIVYTFGGVYSDIDTECLKPIDTWVEAHSPQEVGLIVGVEADGLNIPEWSKSWGRQLQFCQWTFAAVAHHAMLGMVIHRITTKLAAVDVEAIPRDQVTHTTGPTVWTDSVYDYISLQGHTWKEYMGLAEAERAGDLLILTITGFSPGVGHGGSKPKYAPEARVLHMFAGTWTGRAPSSPPPLLLDPPDPVALEHRGPSDEALHKAEAAFDDVLDDAPEFSKAMADVLE